MAHKRRKLQHEELDGFFSGVAESVQTARISPQPIPSTLQPLNVGSLVCFGMVEGILVTLCDKTPAAPIDGLKVLVDASANVVYSKHDTKAIGRIDEESAQLLLSALLAETDLYIQLQIGPKSTIASRTSRSKRTNQSSVHLSIVTYGPTDLYEDIGSFFQDSERHLQDPIGCELNVPYRNPHRISGLDEHAPMTFDLEQPHDSYERVQEPTDLLAGLQTEEIFSESETPPTLKSALYKHQKQALSFMREREQGWALRKPLGDVWGFSLANFAEETYVNNITGDTQAAPPPSFRGGILADDMGLGKTLSMIALIASSVQDGTHQHSDPHCSLAPCKATLLVVPSSLVQQWQDQLIYHLHARTEDPVRWTRHYGSWKLVSPAQLKDFDIVITSFQTLASEYRKSKNSTSLLFSTYWKRIVLDEAHMIRNHNTTTAKAVFELEANCRWAVTGTPLQNRLSDFSSLLQFLRVYPYSNRKVFEDDIVNIWKCGNEELALERLKRLFKYITIRRPRAAIELPKRTDLIRHVFLSAGELDAYVRIESPIVDMLDQALSGSDPKPKTYMHALLKINGLRKFCNIGQSTHLSVTPNYGSRSLNSEYHGNNGVQAILEDLLTSDQASCALCSNDVRFFGEQDTLTVANTPDVYLSECIRILCLVCHRRIGTGDGTPRNVCLCPTPCRLTPAFIQSPPISRVPSPGGLMEDGPFSSKIRALKEDLQVSAYEKSVVFSSWTTTLDMVEAMLKTARISFTRIDGRISAKNRAANLHTFETSPDMRVMLLTIACGAEGLNLTCASRVYLMEPQWNPNIEEQALARVHRLGQTRPVTTVRFIVKGSIENHVIDIQDRKKHLADLLLSQGNLNSSANNRNRLQSLRNLLN